MRFLSRYFVRTITLAIFFSIPAMAAVDGEPVSSTSEDEQKPKFEVTATEVKMPGITVCRATRELRIDATVCLQTGILEYVVCRPNTFEHEAIFTTEAKPELVHAALMLCGLKSTPQLRGMSDLWWEKAMKQKQSRIRIEVEWEQNGKQERVNLTSMLRNRQDITADIGTHVSGNKKEPDVRDAWVFTGSFLQMNKQTGKPFYAANSSGILVGIWPNPSTVIQYGLSSGDPYKGEHLGLEIFEDRVPIVGTPVKLVFSLYADAIKETEFDISLTENKYENKI